MSVLILLWILSICYRKVSSRRLVCVPILDISQLPQTGVLELNNLTSLNGVITIRSDGIPYGGVLEFLIEREDRQSVFERDGLPDRRSYDALIRIEFNRDSVIISSRIGPNDTIGEDEFQLNSNALENSSLLLQLLGRLVACYCLCSF